MKNLFFALASLALLAGCEKAKQDMYDQPKYKPMAASPLWEDGTSARPLPEGTVPHAMGPFSGTSSGRVGEDAVKNEETATHAQTNPYPVTMQLLQRGQNRYTIYCLPCHSPLGDGDGWITRRGFPHPPSYHSDRLRNIPDRHIFDVITNGYGIMYSYADRVTAPDRWAIVAYIRALQLSQHAQVAALPQDMRARLEQSVGSPLPQAGEGAGEREHAVGLSSALTCSARTGSQAGAVQRACGMPHEFPASPPSPSPRNGLQAVPATAARGMPRETPPSPRRGRGEQNEPLRDFHKSGGQP